jgi:hypothetical protein
MIKLKVSFGRVLPRSYRSIPTACFYHRQMLGPTIENVYASLSKKHPHDVQGYSAQTQPASKKLWKFNGLYNFSAALRESRVP